MRASLVLRAIVPLLILLTAQPAAAQFRRGWYARQNAAVFTLLGAAVHEPIVREPWGQELPVRQTNDAYGLKLAYHFAAAPQAGVEVGLSYWKNHVDDFRHQPFQRDTVTYSNTSTSYSFVDFGVDIAPFTITPLAFYGVAGIGLERDHFTTTGPYSWSAENGTFDENEMKYTYGVGARFYPLHSFALSAEVRWVPGKRYHQNAGEYWCTDEYAEGCLGGRDIMNRTRIASLGASIIFP